MEAGSHYLPFSESELLARLVLNASDAARVCGVTTRQLTYWTDKGIVPSHEEDNRSYGADALVRTVLIRKAMEAGHTLEKAADLVNRKLASEQASRSRYLDLDEADLAQELDAYLARIEKSILALQVRLPIYMALCRVMGLLARVQQLTPERLLEESPVDPRANELVARRLDAAIEQASRVLDEVHAGLVLA